MISTTDLLAIMPRCPRHEYAGLLSSAMASAEINTVTRAAAFLGQLAHESGELCYLEELANGQAYEGRKDLGNIEEGDGPKFKGRGWIQLTGRANYRAAGIALDLDLTEEPWQAADPAVAAKIAVWYWTKHGCNQLADGLDFAAITREINGGLKHYSERFDYYVKALAVLGRHALLG